MDLLPNDGSFYKAGIPEDQAMANAKERSEALEVLPFLQDVIDWFAKQAVEAEKLTNLDLESQVPVESQVMAYKLLSELLHTKKGEIETYLSAYDK